MLIYKKLLFKFFYERISNHNSEREIMAYRTIGYILVSMVQLIAEQNVTLVFHSASSTAGETKVVFLVGLYII